MEKYFYGNKVSDYGVENGRVDYATFSKAFDAVLCNDIFNVCSRANDYSIYDNLTNDRCYEVEDPTTGEWIEFSSYSEYEEWREELEAVHDIEANEPEERLQDVFQWYLVPDTPMNRDLLEEAHEIYTYCESLAVLVWGVTHWGTSWDYVLTSIEI